MDPNVIKLAMGAGGPSGPEYKLYIWGQNSFGQLGLGDTTSRSSPVQVGSLTTWNNVACGGFHTIVTKTDKTLWAWGRNNYGQLGLMDTTNRLSPIQVGALSTWSKVACGGHTIATTQE